MLRRVVSIQNKKKTKQTERVAILKKESVFWK